MSKPSESKPSKSHATQRLWNLATLWRREKPQLATTPSDVVHKENKWRLLRYRPRPEGLAYKTPVLMVPSLINRHYVLDLTPGKSLAEYLVAQGHDLWVIDWGTPSAEDRWLDFDTVVDRYLGRAIRYAADTSERGAVHVLGYCMGGTLAAIHTAARPDHVASLLALAAPVAFGKEAGGDALLASWTRNRHFDLDGLVDAFGNVPWQLLQSAFHMLRPTLGLTKAAHVLDRAWQDEFLDGFLALETWGNDNVSFPGECFRSYIGDLYREDRFAKGQLSLGGRPARIEDIRCPLLAISFEHDNIVPWQSAAPLVDRASSEDKERLHLPGGHVGAVVSRKASKGLWPLLSKWWVIRD